MTKKARYKNSTKKAKELGISRQLLKYHIVSGHVEPEKYEVVDTEAGVSYIFPLDSNTNNNT